MGVEALLLGSMAAGTALQAFSQVKGGSQANKASEYVAQEIEHQGAEEARQFIRRGRFAAGAQRAGFAKGGVKGTTGSPLEVLMDTADELERGLVEIGRETQTKAAVERYRGSQAKQASQTGAAGTILGGATQIGTTGSLLGLFGKKPFDPTTSAFHGGFH
jgi:hypothetical protein